MDLFNRIIVILVILAWMILIPLTLIFPEQAHAGLEYAAGVLQSNLDWLRNLAPGAQIGMRVLLAVIALVAFVIGLLFLALEVIRLRKGTVQLKDGSGEVEVNGVAAHLIHYVDLLPDVLRVRPDVHSAGKSVRATLHVDTAPGVHVPTKSNEIRDTARRVLEEQLGLTIKGDVKVVIKPVPPPRDRWGRVLKRTAAPSPPAEEKAEEKAEAAPAQAKEDQPAPQAPKEGETIDVKAPPAEAEAEDAKETP